MIKVSMFMLQSLLLICISACSCGQNTAEKTARLNINNEIEWNCESEGHFTDNRDNKKYKVVKIGTQIWFAENLAYKPDRGSFWAYDNNSENAAKYGYLYSWQTAKNACPPGWHLPGLEEWKKLIDFLGGKTAAARKLKAAAYWKCPDKAAAVRSGFNALPAGNRSAGGSFYHLGEDALFWSSTPEGSGSAWKVRISCEFDSVDFQDSIHRTGRSVRCIRN